MWIFLCIGLIFLSFPIITHFFGNAFLNRYGKGLAERAFAKAHPGCSLEIGTLDYSFAANRIIAQSITLTTTNATLKTACISLTGVRWTGFLWEQSNLQDALIAATLDATNLNIQFSKDDYEIRCARLYMSIPHSKLIASGVELRTLVDDDLFFASRNFRSTRFHIFLPECIITGLAGRELLLGKSYQARSIHFSDPTFEAFVNRYKISDPHTRQPLMVHEALATILQPLKIDSLIITNGSLRYCEQLFPKTAPGVLTFGAVNISAEGIANHAKTSGVVLIRANGRLMNTGMLNVLLTIPISPKEFSLHYSGSLGPMELTNLNAFLDIAEHTRIKAGTALNVSFDVQVTSGHAQGYVRSVYKNLNIAVLNKTTASKKGLGDIVTSFLANMVKIRSSNTPDNHNMLREGKVYYTKETQDEFVQFLWFALRSGIMDLITY